MSHPRPRLDELDFLRGAALLAGLPIAARWILHPRAHLFDATVAEQTPAGMLWWHLTETVCDETWIWLLAAVFGAGLAAARDSDPEWRRSHQARMAILMAAGVGASLLLWPGDVLLLLGLTGLLVTGAVDDTACRPLKAGLAAGGAAIVASLALADGQGLLLMSPRLPNEAAALGNPDYNAWETRMYAGGYAARARWSQTLELWSRMYPARMLWQAGSAMLLGVWWYRHGRHRTWPRWRAAALAAAGLIYSGAATLRNAESGFDDMVVTVTQNGTYVGGALLAASLFVWAGSRTPATWERGAAAWTAEAGRRSLTLYLAGATALGAVSHGWGAGLHGQTNGEEEAAIVLGVLTLVGGLATIGRHYGDMDWAERYLRTATRLASGRRPRRR